MHIAALEYLPYTVRVYVCRHLRPLRQKQRLLAEHGPVPVEHERPHIVE
jgi:hypothetical protein